MSFAIGLKVLKRLCLEQEPIKWYRAKLSPELFGKYEVDAYEWVRGFLSTHHTLPQVETLIAHFPDVLPLEVLEPSSYYVSLLENKYYYQIINNANLRSQEILAHDQDAHEEAMAVLADAQKAIKAQKYRAKMLDVGKEAGDLVITNYQSIGLIDKARFGWPYMDVQCGGVLAGDVVSFIGRPAAGKAQPLDSKVLTLDGFCTMGSLEVGQPLSSIDGRPSRVEAIYPQGMLPVYRLIFQDGRSVEASDEHLWEVFYRAWESPKIFTTAQLIAKLEHKRYQNRLSIRLAPAEFGTPVKSLFSPYLLGMLLGDGCFVAKDAIRLTTADPETVKRVNSELSAVGLTLKKVPSAKYEYVLREQSIANFNRIRQWIESLGLRGHRSEAKFIPPEYLGADRKTRLELLRGLMDSDGTAGKNGDASFSSSSKQLAYDFLTLCRSLGYKARIQPKKTKCLLSYRIQIVAEDRRELFSLTRKVARVAHARTTHTNHRLTLNSIEYVGLKECQCIAVSHPSHLYFTDDFTVTHNTWLTLWTALENWASDVEKTHNVLFVSMEMGILPISQRLTSMYAGVPIQQIKNSGMSQQTYKKFFSSLLTMKKEESKFYIMDANLAGGVEDVYTLADMLNCTVVVIDGAYLLRHPNKRLDRYTKVAENAELIKQYTNNLSMMTFTSWQFAKTATKKNKKDDSEAGLEDIGYSDAIGQVSSIVLGLFQEEGIETLNSRRIRVMKGRNGEVGQFSIGWDFTGMNFAQIDPPVNGESDENKLLEWI